MRPRTLVIAFAAGFATSMLFGFALRFLFVAYKHGGLF
jgi:hypothetical protein